jgi:(2R)-sulfolactate sulfo-lyase subunit beta
MIGAGTNANVAAVIVIGMEPVWVERIVSGIQPTRKPLAHYTIRHVGDLKAIEEVARKAKEFVTDASEIKVQRVSLGDIIISTKCSESDTTNGLAANPIVGTVVERAVEAGSTVIFGETSELTGAEQIIANRIKSRAERDRFWQVYNEYMEFIASQKAELLGSQPSQSNILGGLSTIEEKALGNIAKIGRAQIEGVLDSAESPRGRGLWFMNTSSAAAEVLTMFSAAGSVLCIVPTGQGNIIGNPLMPVIKLTANPQTAKTMSEHFDIEFSAVLRQQMTVEQAGNELLDMVLRVAGGRVTASEVLNHNEFVPVKLYRSA